MVYLYPNPLKRFENRSRSSSRRNGNQSKYCEPRVGRSWKESLTIAYLHQSPLS
ncbi:hypothetical protein CC1G_14812 [Coprinopsis cinerea okayama7|uniref:Uncharacterized protein n=1 Tax=Coprinopsis cinerea (strain Okayama-7 / 130 / ATCC MYA-4618 / FGSC 9003) TaxID=240176 RepID=D6RNP0_COPC7|nr:hypothetical protein CC1G_14812 [Coprinopsis cinerea okayama7\|eukprot:XP_002910833.1 hypothetical protein CC1G_14812 [Coprinopsis cinerea okayama7\